MPLRKSDEELQKVTLFLFARDVRRLRQFYPNKYTTFIRMLVRAHLTTRDAKIAAQGEALSGEIELENEPEGMEEELVDIGEE